MFSDFKIIYAYSRTATFLAVTFKRPTLEGPTWKGQHLSSCWTPSIWLRLSDEGDRSRSSVRWRSSWKVNVNFQSKVKEKANTIVAVKNPYQLCWYLRHCFVLLLKLDCQVHKYFVLIIKTIWKKNWNCNQI